MLYYMPFMLAGQATYVGCIALHHDDARDPQGNLNLQAPPLPLDEVIASTSAVATSLVKSSLI
jgi:hypothetical protein